MKKKISENYMRWLENFTKNNPICTDVEDMYLSDCVTEDDKRNINKLDALFELVENYAELNGINSYIIYDVFKCYRLRYNDIGYEVSASSDNTFCERVEIENKEDFIDFNDIIKFMNYREKNSKRISLLSLRREVRGLISEGVSADLIANTLRKELKRGRQTF